LSSVYGIIADSLTEGFLAYVGLALMLWGGGLVLFDYLWAKPIPQFLEKSIFFRFFLWLAWPVFVLGSIIYGTQLYIRFISTMSNY
jgi:hypothetical protein